MYGYAIVGIVFLVALAGAGFKGYQLGGNAVQVRWDRANVEAAKSVEADRKAQEAKAKKTATVLQSKLATQAITNREISDALDKALRAKPLPPECVIPDGVRELWNRANRGESQPAGELPTAGGTTTPTGKPNR